MNMTDPIADFLTRIRNGCKARFSKVDIPSSEMKKGLARILQEHKFISNFVEIEDGKQNILRVFLRYDQNRQSVITGLERISRPGRRIYYNIDDLGKIRRELGLVVLSTSQGLLTDQKARELKAGGEALLRVW